MSEAKRIQIKIIEDGKEIISAEGRGVICFLFDDLSKQAGTNKCNTIHHGRLSSIELASEIATITRDGDPGHFGPVAGLWQKAIALYLLEISNSSETSILNKHISEAEAFAAGAIAEAEGGR